MNKLTMDIKLKPYIEIVEQPCKAIRFRYECERRSHGPILGINSTPSNKTYPTIRIVGLNAEAQVLVSCVTKEPPYRAHPHHIVTKESNENHGVYRTTVGPESGLIELKSLGIQCVKRKDIKNSLEDRKRIRVDPFSQGFNHADDISGINLNTVRLCIQAFLMNPITKECIELLDPVVTDPIYDRQSQTNLNICRLSTFVGSACGGTILIIYSDKVMKQDVKVRFYEEVNERIVWEAYGNFRPSDVYKKTAIFLTTPAYHSQHIDQPVDIWIQLIRPSDGECGTPVKFQLVPSDHLEKDYVEPEVNVSRKRKRKKFNDFDFINHSNRKKCGCIVGPIIHPECLVHNSVPMDLTIHKTNHKSVVKSMVNENMWNISRGRSVSHANPAAHPVENQKYIGHFESHLNTVYGQSPAPFVFCAPMNSIQNTSNYPQRITNNQNYLLSSSSASRPAWQYTCECPLMVNPAANTDPPRLLVDNRIKWMEQPEPILQPFLVKLSDQKNRPTNNFDHHPAKNQYDVNQNQVDFDVDAYLNSLSDSVSGLTLSEEKDISMEKESIKFDDNNKNNTADSLSRVCNDAIEEILEISRMQNCTKNNMNEQQKVQSNSSMKFASRDVNSDKIMTKEINSEEIEEAINVPSDTIYDNLTLLDQIDCLMTTLESPLQPKKLYK